MRREKRLSGIGLVVAMFAWCALTQVAVAGQIQINVSVFGNPQAMPDGANILSVQKFKEEMEKRAGDKVKVTIYWDSKLGGTYEASINGVHNGLIHLTEVTISNFAEFSKACTPLTNAFVFPYPHYQIAHQVIDGEVGDIFRNRVKQETGLRIVGFWDTGFRHLTSVRKPVDTLDDLKGMKIRVQPNPIHIAAFKALGANPTPIAYSELFTALQQNVVDGAENPFENLVQARLYEVQKFMTLSGHTFEFVLYLTSEDFYQSLPEDVRAAWDESIDEAKKVYRETTILRNQDYFDFLKKRMDIRELSSEELAKFREAVKPSYAECISLVGKEYFDRVMGEIAKVEKEYLESLPAGQ